MATIKYKDIKTIVTLARFLQIFFCCIIKKQLPEFLPRGVVYALVDSVTQ